MCPDRGSEVKTDSTEFYQLLRSGEAEERKFRLGAERKGRYNMGAFVADFIIETIRLIALAAVALAAIFCGKKLRDRKDAK